MAQDSDEQRALLEELSSLKILVGSPAWKQVQLNGEQRVRDGLASIVSVDSKGVTMDTAVSLIHLAGLMQGASQLIHYPFSRIEVLEEELKGLREKEMNDGNS